MANNTLPEKLAAMEAALGVVCESNLQFAIGCMTRIRAGHEEHAGDGPLFANVEVPPEDQDCAVYVVLDSLRTGQPISPAGREIILLAARIDQLARTL